MAKTSKFLKLDQRVIFKFNVVKYMLITIESKFIKLKLQKYYKIVFNTAEHNRFELQIFFQQSKEVNRGNIR